MKIYQSYLFRTKDPAIDQLRTIIQRSNGNGKLTRKSLKQVEIGGGPVVGTMANWFFGAVKRPQNATLEAAGRALGYRRVWKRMNVHNRRAAQ
jgi:hypothetical protein